jgi:hypothetical protein
MHRQRISTDAERGYEYLRAGRNRARAESAGWGVAAASNVPAAAWSAAARRPVMAGANAALAAGTGAMAVQQGMKARRWNAKMGKIKARAKQRAQDGQYGRDRQVMVDKAGVVSKATPRIPAPRSTPVRPRYGVRSGSIVRVGSRSYTRRGTIAGTGRLRMPRGGAR